MNIEFLATGAVIAPDPTASRRLYVDALGLPLEGDDYQQSEQIAGCKSFGIWPLHQAAECVLRVAAVARGAACAAGQHRRHRKLHPFHRLAAVSLHPATIARSR